MPSERALLQEACARASPLECLRTGLKPTQAAWDGGCERGVHQHSPVCDARALPLALPAAGVAGPIEARRDDAGVERRGASEPGLLWRGEHE